MESGNRERKAATPSDRCVWVCGQKKYLGDVVYFVGVPGESPVCPAKITGWGFSVSRVVLDAPTSGMTVLAEQLALTSEEAHERHRAACQWRLDQLVHWCRRAGVELKFPKPVANDRRETEIASTVAAVEAGNLADGIAIPRAASTYLRVITTAGEYVGTFTAGQLRERWGSLVVEEALGLVLRGEAAGSTSILPGDLLVTRVVPGAAPHIPAEEPRRLSDEELGGRAALEAAGLEPVDGWDDERADLTPEQDAALGSGAACVATCEVCEQPLDAARGDTLSRCAACAGRPSTKVYQIQFDGEQYYAEAASFGEAVLLWRGHVAELWGEDYQETDEPESVVLLGDGPVLRSAVDWGLLDLLVELKRAAHDAPQILPAIEAVQRRLQKAVRS